MCGCTATIRKYDGPQLPRGQVAIIQDVMDTSRIGKGPPWSWRINIEVLPGHQTVGVGCDIAGAYRRVGILDFNAEAGHTYRVRERVEYSFVVVTEYNGTKSTSVRCLVWIEDTPTGAVVARNF